MDGRMFFFLYIVASMIAVTHSQDYTVGFPFVPGRFLVPEDGAPVPVGNRVYVQLPNTTDVLEARIRQSVNTTLDCGLFIDRVIALPLTRNFYTYWTVRPRTTEGGFTDNPSNLTAGESASGIEIFGDNDRFLRSANPELSSSARQTNIGLFTCYFCYDETNPLSGGIVRSLCTNSSSDVNIIGTSPTINRNDSTGPNELTIGRNICLETVPQSVVVINLKCSQIGTINPEPTSVFTFNGEMIGSNFPQDRDTLSIIPQLLQPPVQGEIRCVLMNRFGNDTEASQLLLNATSDFSGTINGMSDSGCPPGTASNVLCPRIGQQVNLNCATNLMNSFNITRPDSTIVTNRNLSFTMGPNDYGTYTCTGFNECNQSPSTIELLQQCRLPEVCTAGPQRYGRPIQNHCFRYNHEISGAVINCDPKFDCSNPDNEPILGRKWFIDGIEQTLQTSFSIRISQPGSYTCEITHTCGTIRSVVATIPRDPPVITNGTSTVLNPSRPVTVGNTVCLDASVSNPSVQLDCAISNRMNSNLTNITWSPGGTTQAGVTSASLTVTMTGTYTCTAANDCGSVTASTVVRNTPSTNVTGLVAGISGNGCFRAGSRKRICADVGMSITIMCAVGPGDTYTITGPGESSNNVPLAFTVADNNYGDFTCTSTNPCGSVTDTIRLERADCPLPDVTVSVQRGDGTIVDPPCLRTDNDLFVSCADSLSGSTVAWYINGALMSNTGSRQRVTVSGNYTCVTTSTCGSVASTTFMKEAPTIAPGTGIIANPGIIPVPAGTRTCISRNGVGYSVRLVCNLSYNNESVSDVTFSWSTPGGGSQSGSTITASSIGDYTCTASNQCGSSQATTEVLGRIELIKGTDIVIEQTINIGSWLCINSNNSFTINCNTVFGTSVTRTWRKYNGVIRGVTGSSYIATPSDLGHGWLYCEAMNPCGKDVANSPILSQTPVTIRGRIPALNISDNGCTRPGITSTCADLCPLDGERVEISCSTKRRYIISGPGGRSSDRPLFIRNFHLSDSGTYFCISRDAACGAAVDSIIVSGPGVPPSISTNPPGILTFSLPSTIMNATIPIGFAICLLEHQFVTIDCRTESGTEPIRFTWTAASTGNRVIASGMRITVNNTDVYTCNATNAFGTSTASSTIEHTPAVNVTGEVEGILGNGCSGTDTRKRICAEVGLSITIMCAVGPGDTYTITGPGESSNNVPLAFTVADNNYGDFICTSTNPCGNVTDIIRLEKADCSCSIPNVTVSIRKGGNTCGKQDITVSVINN